MLSEKEQALRAQGVGASEVGALVGLDPYRGPIDIWRKKVEGWRSEQNEHTRRGNFLERAILDWYAAETGAELSPGATGASTEHPLVLATPDGLTPDRTVEAKAPSFRTAHEWADAAAPDRYVAQVTQQMLVFKRERSDIVAYVDEGLSIVPIHYDAELAASLVDAIETFWRKHVLTGTPPPADASESYSEWIKGRFAKTRGEIVEATPDAEEWARRLLSVRATIEAAELVEREARSNLQTMIGDAAGMRGCFGRISWKHNKDTTKVDWEKVAREAGATEKLIEKHTQEKAGPRVFRLTASKGETI